jgi:hypothetical protein
MKPSNYFNGNRTDLIVSNRSYYARFTNGIGQKLVFYICPKNANTSIKSLFVSHLNLDQEFIFVGDNIPKYMCKAEDFQNKTNLVDFMPAKQPFAPLASDIVDIKACIIRDPLKRFISAYSNRILWHKDQVISIDQMLEDLLTSTFSNDHFLPQSFFLGHNLSYYEWCFDIDDFDLMAQKINQFFKKELPFPKLQTRGDKDSIQLSNDQIDKIKLIYQSDYELLNSM